MLFMPAGVKPKMSIFSSTEPLIKEGDLVVIFMVYRVNVDLVTDRLIDNSRFGHDRNESR